MVVIPQSREEGIDMKKYLLVFVDGTHEIVLERDYWNEIVFYDRPANATAYNAITTRTPHGTETHYFSYRQTKGQLYDSFDDLPDEVKALMFLYETDL